MPDPAARRGAVRPRQLAAALAVAAAVWLGVRGRETVRATVPVAVPAGAAGGVDGPGAVHAVVEGPAAAILVLRVRPPALRDGVLVGGAAAAAAPGDVVLPRGAGAVTVHAVVVGRADQRAARAP
jgi:hypothetical protein